MLNVSRGFILRRHGGGADAVRCRHVPRNDRGYDRGQLLRVRYGQLLPKRRERADTLPRRNVRQHGWPYRRDVHGPVRRGLLRRYGKHDGDGEPMSCGLLLRDSRLDVRYSVHERQRVPGGRGVSERLRTRPVFAAAHGRVRGLCGSDVQHADERRSGRPDALPRVPCPILHKYSRCRGHGAEGVRVRRRGGVGLRCSGAELNGWIKLQHKHRYLYSKHVPKLLHGLFNDAESQHHPRVLNDGDDRRHFDGPRVDRNSS